MRVYQVGLILVDAVVVVVVAVALAFVVALSPWFSVKRKHTLGKTIPEKKPRRHCNNFVRFRVWGLGFWLRAGVTKI